VNTNNKKLIGAALVVIVGLIPGGYFLTKKHFDLRFTQYTISPTTCKAGSYLPLLVYSNYANGSVSKNDPKTYKIKYSTKDESAQKLNFEELVGTVFINCKTVGVFPVKAVVENGKQSIEISNSINVIPGDPEKITIVSGNHQTVIANEQLEKPLTIKVSDHWDNPVGNVEIKAQVESDEGKILGSTLVSSDEGIISIPVQAGTKSGISQVKVIGNFAEKQAIESFDFTTQSSVPAKLTFEGNLPKTIIAGQTFPKPKIAIADEFNNPLTKTIKGIKVQLYLDSECKTPKNEKLRLFKNDIAVTQSGTVYLGATQNELTACSSPILVMPAPAKQFTYDSGQKNETVEVGSVFPTQLIRTIDSFGNDKAPITEPITVTSFIDHNCTKELKEKSVKLDEIVVPSNLVQLNNLTYVKSEPLYLKVTTKDVSPICIGPFVFHSAQADHLVLVSGNQQAKSVNTNLEPVVVKVVDKYENPVPEFKVNFKYSGSKELVSAISDPSGLASAFIKLDSVMGDKTIVADSDLLTNKNASIQLTVKVTASLSDHLIIKTQPAKTLIAGKLLTTLPTVQVVDKFNNSSSESNRPIYSAKFKDAECKTLIADKVEKESTTDGLATFQSITDEKSEPLFIEFSSPGLKSICSESIQVLAAEPAQITITQESGVSSAGATFYPPLNISVLDKFGNVSDFHGALNLTLSDSTVKLNGTTSLNAKNGLASFSDLSINESKNKYSIKVTGDNLTAASTQSFSILPGPAEQLAILSTPQNLAVAQCSKVVEVQTQDRFNNPSLLEKEKEIKLEGALAGFYLDDQCTTPVDKLIIKRGHSDSEFYFDRKEVGELTLSVTSTELKEATQKELTTVAQAKQIKLSGNSSILAGECAGPFSIETLDEFNNKSSPKEDLAINLSDSKSGVFYTDSVCSHPISSVTFNKDKDDYYFYIKDDRAESFTFKAESQSKELSPQSFTVEAKGLKPAQLKISGPDSVDINQCSKPFKVQLKDQFNNNVKTESSLSLTPTLIDQASFFSDSDCLSISSNLTIDSDSDSVLFYYKSSTAGANRILMEGSGLKSDAITTLVASNNVATQINITNQPSAGIINEKLKEELQVSLSDSFNNVITNGSNVIKIEAYTDSNCTDKAEGVLKSTAVSSIKGIATFSGISYSQAESIYLKASSDKMEDACSNAIIFSEASKEE
jgi:hypothetical protein